MSLNAATGELVNLPYYTLTTEQWGVIWALDTTATTGYLVQYECFYNWFGFMDAGIFSDQVNIYTRSGAPPTPTQRTVIDTEIKKNGLNIDITPSNFEAI